jgi:phosphonate transport system substrate-binding protein
MVETRNHVHALLFFVFIAFAPAALSAHTITVGTIGGEPDGEIKRFMPVATYLSRKLRAEGFTEGGVVVAQAPVEMAALFRERKVDLYIDSYFRALSLNRLAGSQLVLRRWKKGVAEYHGVIFARKDSNIGKLEDLRGKTVALDEMSSAVAYLLPKMLLIEKGLSPVHSSVPLGGRAVGYTFSNDDENTMQWVLNGRTAAGAIDHQKYVKEARSRIDELKILEQTPSVPRHVVSARPDISPKLLSTIKEILTRMDRSEEGRKILQDFEQTAKFDELTEQNVALAQRLKKIVEAELKLK